MATNLKKRQPCLKKRNTNKARNDLICHIKSHITPQLRKHSKPFEAEFAMIEYVQFSRTIYRNMYEQEERDIEKAIRVLAKFVP